MHPHPVVRTTLIALTTLVATAAIGFGGIASWAVTTQNNGSSLSSGTVHHRNVATVGGAGVPVTCTDQAGACGAIFTLANARPGSSASGTVQITNTGTLASTFALALVSATTSGAGATLCANLQMRITDAEAAPVTVYNGALATMPVAAVNQTAGSAVWVAGDNDTFTFTVTLPLASPSSDMGSTCTAVYRWTQTNT